MLLILAVNIPARQGSEVPDGDHPKRGERGIPADVIMLWDGRG